MNVVKFLRTPFLKNTSERLLLKILGSCFEVNAEAYSEPNQASEAFARIRKQRFKDVPLIGVPRK